MIETPRLQLRKCREEDLAVFAEMNADPRVMEFFPKLLSPAESAEVVTRIVDHWDRHGFGLWAVTAIGVADFIGFVGLSMPRFTAPFTPCAEIGWRLAFDYWNRGYATEAAEAALRFGFEQLQRDEIVSFTVPDNLRSRRVMERLGMSRSADDDFDHPNVPESNRCRRHVLYRMSRAAWNIRRQPHRAL